MPSRIQLSVVVPTYCESANLAELCHRLAAALHRKKRSFEIIVVDDDSPDDTQRVCQQLAKKYPLRLIVRKGRRGLSSAVIEGLAAAGGELLVVMDADLSHAPETVPDLVALVEHPEVEMAIGSRYVKGASTAGNWGLLRQWNSRVATWLARGLTKVNDPMAGFFALRRDMFRRAQPLLDPVGFKIGLELIVKTGCRAVVETPIHFANRRHGTSKLTWRQQLQYLLHLARLYRYRYSRSARPLEPATQPAAEPAAARRAA